MTARQYPAVVKSFGGFQGRWRWESRAEAGTVGACRASTSVENNLRPLQAGPMEHPSDTPVSEPRQSDNQEIRKLASIRTPRGVMRVLQISQCQNSDDQTIRQSDN